MEPLDESMPAEQAAWLDTLLGKFKDQVHEALRLAVLHEREACMRLAEAQGAHAVAAAIRARALAVPTPKLFSVSEESPSPRVPAALVEKRTALRFPAGGKEVTLAEASRTAETFGGRLIDFSESGLGILVNREVAKGARLIARAAHAAANTPAAELEVRYCISTGSGWRIGCRFGQTPRRVAMALLGLNPAQGSEAPS